MPSLSTLDVLELMRLDASWYLPAPIHPASLVDAIREVAARYPASYSTEGLRGNVVAHVAVELGCSWAELRDVEDLTTGLNEAYTPGAPLRFDGLAAEYWSLLDDLSAAGWRWDAIAKRVYQDYENHLSDSPF
jgi:DNA-binding NarL/FixJ family response regulator